MEDTVTEPEGIDDDSQKDFQETIEVVICKDSATQTEFQSESEYETLLDKYTQLQEHVYIMETKLAAQAKVIQHLKKNDKITKRRLTMQAKQIQQLKQNK